MQNNYKKIFISSVELSGDLLGANVARALLKKNPHLHLIGMGGKKMQDAGVAIAFNAEKLAVVGIIEVFTHLFSILFTWHKIKKYFRSEKPDLVILIDAPDTHFRFLKTLKKLNIPVLYYVSPQIWAWRSSRIKQIQKYVSHMAVLFSFEEKIYRDANMPVTFVGHPLGKLVKPSMSKEAAYEFFGFDKKRALVTLFPGSRNSELKNNLAVMLESVKIILSEKKDIQFALMLAEHFDAKKICTQLPADIKIIQKNMYDLLQITDAAIAVSGTVTLEIALMQVPHCILYRFNALTYWIAKKLIRVKYIGLSNIVAEKYIAKEFIQDNARPEFIAAEIMRLLSDKNYVDQIKIECTDLKNKVSIADRDSSDMVANIAIGLIQHSEAF